MHILSLLFACLGASVAGRVLALDAPEWLGASGALLLVAGGCALIAMQINRRQWGEFMARKLRMVGQLESQVRELEARLKVAELRCQSEEETLAGVAAAVNPLLQAAQAAEAASVPATRPADPAKPSEELIRLISHEARTPLATIHAYSELLLDGEPLDEATRLDFFGIIHTETERLSLVLDSLLNLARIDNGAISVRTEVTSLDSLVAPVVHGVIALADLRKVTVELDLASASQVVEADRELLAQAIRNLLAHVVKHAGPGDRVSVRTSTNTTDRNVLLEITGDRTGIPPKDLPHPLDSFYGGGKKHDRTVPPGAAGLALSRRVIEAIHGGETIVRVSGSACTLGFALPVSQAVTLTPAGLPPAVSLSPVEVKND
ncbi:sensor histidine kinase [Humisphaera borealis]|uniref:histidine kinase n=1 Tax=Humisphaera borealis TaxID=2807512 RepID=A0A7M2WXL4_9BACT|nr:ATP-binding protein [Humisphaera borealis]QOV90235.1 hypothetical protein IPV69_02350 [Humisphaera borealis]